MAEVAAKPSHARWVRKGAFGAPVFCGTGTKLEELAKAPGNRWRVEIGFEEARAEGGLSHYEVRSWHGWYRHITLALFAHAFLAAIRDEGIDIEPSQKGPGEPVGIQEKARALIELTVCEIRRLCGVDW